MKIGELVGHFPDTLVYKEDPQNWLAPGLKIGIEIEAENPKGVSITKGNLEQIWGFHQDGSLRDGGIELTLDKPLFGLDLTLAINLVEEWFNKNLLEFNYRTGLHVHVDCRSLDPQELQRLFILYSLFEKSIFNFIGDQRNNNNFCAPWSRISDHLPGVFSIFNGTSQEEATRALRNTERYSALNCQALIKFGSIEFRHMQMSRDFDKIRKWINLIMSLYTGSLENAPYGPRIQTDLLIREAVKGGARQIARTIFPEWFIRFIDDKSIWEGILLVQDIAADITNPLMFKKNSVLSVCPFPGTYPGYKEFIAKSSSQEKR